MTNACEAPQNFAFKIISMKNVLYAGSAPIHYHCNSPKCGSVTWQFLKGFNFYKYRKAKRNPLFSNSYNGYAPPKSRHEPEHFIR